MPLRPRGLRDDYRRDAHIIRNTSQTEVQVVPGIDPETFVPALKEHIRRTYEQNLVNVKKWRLLSEIPSPGELLGENDDSDDGGDYAGGKKSFLADGLPHNIVDGPWPNKEDYVEAHYTLLREDVIAPLRNAAATFRACPEMLDDREIAIYDHVHIIGYTFSNQGPAARVEFSYERAGKRIRWRQSRRLQQGTLIMLTPRGDNFRKVYKVAVVAARPLTGLDRNPPQIDLFWGDPGDMEFDSTEAWTMIEARTGYFEANRHMLVAMQKLMTESFPMADQLVNLERLVAAPGFVKAQPLMNLNSLSNGVREPDGIEGLALEDSSVRLDNVDILSGWPEIEGTKLDKSQMEALRRILSKQIAIVQGPPGTGKTFVSISAIVVMLDNWLPGDPPIIVAAQTNHALDQLLTLIERVEPNFLRLGGRTEKENKLIKEHTLYEIRSKAPNAAKAPYYNFKNAKKALDDHAAEMKADIEKTIAQDPAEAELLRDLGIITKDQYDSLSNDDWACAHDSGLPPGLLAAWLGRTQITTNLPRCPPINMGLVEEELDPDFEDLNEDELEVGKDDDDMDTLRGEFYTYREAWTGKSAMGWSVKRVKKLLNQTKDLWEIPDHIRGEVYRYLRRQLKKELLDAFRTHGEAYRHSCQSVKLARWLSDATMVKRLGIKLIGCTTTGLSKYRGLLACLEPRTLLIEEAAETTEGTILAAMFASVEQLILVGDHQQLQAHCNVHELGDTPYNLSVSMFERLVNNGVEFTMLNRQRRMIKEIRELLNPFYPDLRDHPSVDDRLVNRKPVPGMGGRDSYFFHHQWPESRDETASRSNIDEAEMIAKFYKYLVLNGVDATQITILTFYNGQRKKLLSLLKAVLLPMGTTSFNVYTVDSYQGEENDIILLSLVRSNDTQSIGFLENKNRAVVSLSRARRGFYIFGNARNLIGASNASFNLWGTVTDTFKKFGRIDTKQGLPVVCENHGTTTFISEPHEWDTINGGCEQDCGGELPCGHPCPHACHPFPHDSIVCTDSCANVLTCGHPCGEQCGDPCQCSCNNSVRHMPPKTDFCETSLDEILGEEPVMGGNILQTSTKRHGISNKINVPSPKGVENWRAWDATQADREAHELVSRQREELARVSPQKVVIEETHRSAVIGLEDQGLPAGTKIRSVHRWKSIVPKDSVSVYSTKSDAQTHPDDSPSFSVSSNASRDMEELLDVSELAGRGEDDLFNTGLFAPSHTMMRTGAGESDGNHSYDTSDLMMSNLSPASDDIQKIVLDPLQCHITSEEDLITFD